MARFLLLNGRAISRGDMAANQDILRARANNASGNQEKWQVITGAHLHRDRMGPTTLHGHHHHGGKRPQLVN